MLHHLDVIAGTIVSLGVLGGLFTGLWRVVARITRVHDVILGSDTTPGVAARLDILEDRTLQLVANGGTSMKDRVTNLTTQVDLLVRKQDEDRLQTAELRGVQVEQTRLLQHDINNVRATTALLTELMRQTIQKVPE